MISQDVKVHATTAAAPASDSEAGKATAAPKPTARKAGAKVWPLSVDEEQRWKDFAGRYRRKANKIG
ncbi:hypothetical protein WJX72_002539 [[Myrmecia] bisecta]|uniref:Uncharacterized protein n=1 Tax=[Myrmecia] bisecta TaxID=41462 RepID=A0AAW1PRW3_9CHLO